MTFECWVRPELQPGKRQFIGGLWGPNKDNNDQWVLYIQDNQIVFALSADASFKGDVDNTIATANVADLYTRGWVHIAAVWDGVTTVARIYVDGVLLINATNSLFPITHLHPIESKTLSMQLASCNALYDDTVRFRTFKGKLDEIRLWRRALSQPEVLCQRYLSLNGNEPGLIMYFRCNEPGNTQFMCDAAGNFIGRMRSGAFCDTSNRVLPVTFAAVPASVTGNLACTVDTTLSFTVIDTAFCGDRVNIGVFGGNSALFTVSPTTAVLQQNVPFTFTVQLHATLIGPISTDLYVYNQNRCNAQIRIPIRYNRSTELSYSKGSLNLDTLYVGCIQETSREDTVTICNVSNRAVTISKAIFDSLRYSYHPAAPSGPLPQVLPPGACWKIVVHMDVLDSSKTLYDTLRIVSDDRCPGSGAIPIFGRSQEVIALLAPNGKTRVDSMNFGRVCPGFISNVQLYQYRGLVPDTVHIDSITYSTFQFFGAGFQFPLKLAPKNAYTPTYIRFKPDKPGPFTGEMTLYSSYRGCSIVKHIQLAGVGISVDVGFDQPNILFGNVTIGKFKQITVTVTNHGKDSRPMSTYLKVGDVFAIVAGKSFTINPGETKSITVEFRPRELKTYPDTLCLFDQGCYQSVCIPITGTGVFDQLSFTPPFLRMDNVIGCKCQTDTVIVENISSGSVTITSDNLNDPSGKLKMISGSYAGSFAAGRKLQYIVQYCPNDLNQDRADDAYIDIKLSDGQIYQVLIRATSVAPKLYVTPLTTFNIVEVGWQKRDSILVENESAVPLHVTSVSVPPGYVVIQTFPPLPTTLNPRDTLWVEVEFRPLAETSYDGPITLSLDDPCSLSYSGVITGRGQIVRLEVAMSFINYGLIKPCDCVTRVIPLPNYSNTLPISIDSIWIDGAGVASPFPAVFNWSSKVSPTGALPYLIPKLGADTLLVSFCPNIPAILANTLTNATLHIKASKPGWSQTFTTVLSGRRELNFQPSKVLASFPATRVDTSAAPINVDISVPDAFVNPSGDSVIIDAISFAPDQKVFSAVAANGAPLPWIIHRNQKFSIKVSFFPRAPKDYVARLLLHTIFPCVGYDTSILCKGTGFAPAFGLQMAFDTSIVGKDTIHLTTCDTLTLPIMISRAIPQSIIDILFRLQYDTTSLKFLDIVSQFTTDATVNDSSGNALAKLKNARNVQAGVVATLRFIVRGTARGFPIILDNIFFDSDSLVFFKIVAGLDKGYIRIDDPMITITQKTSFDTVNARSCDDRIVIVRNPGLIPVRFDSLSGLPKWHTVTKSSKPYPTILQPGDSIVLTVTFCPRSQVTFDTSMLAVSNQPCPIADSGALHSFGYAAPFPFTLSIGGVVTTVDSVRGQIADTVYVPILIDRDFPLSPIDMNYSLQYNRRSLEYMSVASKYAKATVTQLPGGISIKLPGSTNVKKGEIARVKFVIAVPDSILTLMILSPDPFTSDSDLWLTPKPAGDTTMVRVDKKCNITRLVFTTGINTLSVPVPNPSTNRVRIDVEFVEDANATLKIFDATGREVYRPLSGDVLMKGGKYSVDLDVSRFSPGAYFYRIEAGTYRETKRMLILR
jgi:hypothetical protein